MPYNSSLSLDCWLNLNSNKLHSGYNPYIDLIFSNVGFSTVPWPEKEAQCLIKLTFHSSLQNTTQCFAGLQHGFMHNIKALPLWNQKLNMLIDVCVFSFALNFFFFFLCLNKPVNLIEKKSTKLTEELWKILSCLLHRLFLSLFKTQL